jgi:hypothetical protein
MHSTGRHIEREKRTIEKMVGLYCRAKHSHRNLSTCPECSTFLRYAHRRLDKCPYGDAKPTCSNCPIHCYKPAEKQQVAEIMRYAGPRMLFRHPILAIQHQFDGLRRNVLHPRELTRAERQSRAAQKSCDSN